MQTPLRRGVPAFSAHLRGMKYKPRKLRSVMASALIVATSVVGIVRWRQSRVLRQGEASKARPTLTARQIAEQRDAPVLTSNVDVASAWENAMNEADADRRAAGLLKLARQARPSDLPVLLELVERLDEPEFRFELSRVLLAKWGRLDPAAAMAYAQSYQFDPHRALELMAAVLKEWASAAPTSAIAWFATLEASERFRRIYSALAEALTDQSPERIHEMAGPITEETARARLCEAVVERWKESKPAAAAQLIMKLTGGQSASDLLGQVLPHWSRADLKAAVRWAEQLPPNSTRTAALIHLSYAWVEANPAEAATFARDLGADHGPFLAAVIGGWTRQDPKAAATWVQQLPASPTRDSALASLSATWAEQDPSSAFGFALGLPLGGAQQEAVISILSAWAAKDPGTAARWLLTLPEGRPRDYAIENVVYQWAQKDTAAAVTWLQQLPAGSQRDIALNAGAGCLVDEYPDLAAQMAHGISDASLRNRQVERAARAWLGVDREAARAWILQSNLPSSLKRQLLRAS